MKTLLLLSLLLFCFFPGGLFAEEAETDAFQTVMEHYDAIRLVLLNDEITDVQEHGKAIHAALAELEKDFSAERAGVSEENAAEARSLLPKLVETSEALAKAEAIEAMRTALYELSKPLVRYRKYVDGALPSVAYCSMHKKSWLQPKGEEIGNPYAGQSMPKCGDVVTP